MTTITARACTTCGLEFPLDAFPPEPNRKDGRRAQCRTCYNARQRAIRNARRHGKQCDNCWKHLPLLAFPANPLRPDGRGTWCTTCVDRAGRRTRNAIAMRRRQRLEAEARERTAAARIENGPDRAWWRRAVCRMDNAEGFFPTGVTEPALTQIAEAKAICLTRCPVFEQCRKWALDTGQNNGVLGGLSEEERRAIHRQARRERERATA